MRRLLPLLALLCLSCRTPAAFSWPTQQTPETAACVAKCGDSRNGCVEARRFYVFWLIPFVYGENACTAQFDHCVSVCPGVRETPADLRQQTPPDSATPLHR